MENKNCKVKCWNTKNKSYRQVSEHKRNWRTRSRFGGGIDAVLIAETSWCRVQLMTRWKKRGGNGQTKQSNILETRTTSGSRQDQLMIISHTHHVLTSSTKSIKLDLYSPCDDRLVGFAEEDRDLRSCFFSSTINRVARARAAKLRSLTATPSHGWSGLIGVAPEERERKKQQKRCITLS